MTWSTRVFHNVYIDIQIHNTHLHVETKSMLKLVGLKWNRDAQMRELCKSRSEKLQHWTEQGLNQTGSEMSSMMCQGLFLHLLIGIKSVSTHYFVWTSFQFQTPGSQSKGVDTHQASIQRQREAGTRASARRMVREVLQELAPVVIQLSQITDQTKKTFIKQCLYLRSSD